MKGTHKRKCPCCGGAMIFMGTYDGFRSWTCTACGCDKTACICGYRPFMKFVSVSSYGNSLYPSEWTVKEKCHRCGKVYYS